MTLYHHRIHKLHIVLLGRLLYLRYIRGVVQIYKSRSVCFCFALRPYGCDAWSEAESTLAQFYTNPVNTSITQIQRILFRDSGKNMAYISPYYATIYYATI